MKPKCSSRSLAATGLAGSWLGWESPAFAQSPGKARGKKELADLVSNAKIAHDHKKPVAHHRPIAAKHAADAREHTELAAKCKVHPTPMKSGARMPRRTHLTD